MPSLLLSIAPTFAAAVMFAAIVFQLLLGWNGAGVGSARADPPFNNPPGVDIWCGKAYRDTNSSFDPGGWLFPPNASDNRLKLDLRIYPRYDFYLAGETTASFIIDTPLQYVKGQPFNNATRDPANNGTGNTINELDLQITNVQTNDILVNWTRIPVNATGYEVKFSLKSMAANTWHPWTVSAIATSPDKPDSYYGGTTVTVLPGRNDTGSVARIDRLYGGMHVKSSLTKGDWKPVFPYSFYTAWDWIESTINNATATKNLTTFRQNGYNLIHPVPPGGTDPFNHTVLEEFLKICDDLELYVMYDMRHTYQNDSSVSDQLSRLQSHPSLLLYYTADEPDGSGDPLNATSLSYKHIKSIDAYHPVSLVLNCANFYFREYTSGADIILEDAYPVAANMTFSTVYHTACNATYGDCGCDNCHANDPAYPAYVKNPFLDVSERTESMYAYQEWIGNNAKKPVWGVPQGFWDKGSFWDRWPTGQEEAVMGILRMNRGAKGIVAWIYPTSDDIEAVTSSLAKVVTSDDVTRFVLGSPRSSGLEISGADGLLDATAWTLPGNATETLVSYVYQGYEEVEGSVEIALPRKVSSAVTELWGPGGWTVKSGDEKRIVKDGVNGLEVGILKFKNVE